MSFCSVCDNSYNISKSIETISVQKGGKLNEEEIIKHILDNKVIESKVLASINLKELVEKPDYKKLLNKDKEFIYNVILHQQDYKEEKKTSKKGFAGNRAYFKCDKCGNQELIKNKTLIYSNILSKNMQNNMSEDTSYMIYDNTLPRTREYICENKQCITHKEPNKREAVFKREENTYKLIYLCTVCNTKWNLI